MQQSKFDHFWKKGNGKSFSSWANHVPDAGELPYDNYFLEHDQKTDLIVSNSLKDQSFHAIMRNLTQENGLNHVPENFKSLVDEVSEIPAWLNQDLLQSGAELSQRAGLNGLLILRNFSLLGGYYFSNLTKPLVLTGALEKGATHRLYNTLQFWSDVSRTGEKGKSERIKASLKIRLIHSASRILILEKNPNWDIQKWGYPINIADSVATNIAFTLYFLYGLEKLEFRFTEKEEAGIFHLWKYVTWMLGVPTEMIPNNRQEAVDYFHYWTSKQNGPDADSLKLVTALLKENTQVDVLKIGFVKRNIGFIHKSIANYLIDEQIRESLQIPTIPFKGFFPAVIKLKNRFFLAGTREKQIKRGNEEQLSVLADYRKAVKKD